MRYLTSLNTKLTLLVAPPLVVLVVVAGLGVVHASSAVTRIHDTADGIDVALAGAALAQQLALEGELSATEVASDATGASLELTAQRQKTDKTAEAFEHAISHADEAVRLHMADALDGLDGLDDLRTAVDEGHGTPGDILDRYQARAEPALATERLLGRDSPAATAMRLDAYLALSQGIQSLVREQGLVEGMLRSGVVDPGAYLRLVEVGATQRLWLDRFEDTAPTEDLERYSDIQATPGSDRLDRLRDRAVADGPGAAADGSTQGWSQAASQRIAALQAVASHTARGLTTTAAAAESTAARDRTMALLWFVVALVLLGAGVLLLRRLVLRPTRLLVRASHPATETMPRAVERAETKREATNGMFLNFGHRTQTLVTQQLRHIDSLEARADNPDTLADLFLLDHLATRLRRNAESMVVLAGAESARPWARPVSVTNLVRAAVAEASDYSRVDLAPMPPAMIDGSCANDLSHLVSELVDTALGNSAEDARVTITGRSVGDPGYVVAVTALVPDLSSDELAVANALIACPPLAGPREARHFGLFVAGQIARRYDIPVRLARSGSNAVAAEILLPPHLLATDTSASALTVSVTDRESPRVS